MQSSAIANARNSHSSLAVSPLSLPPPLLPCPTLLPKALAIKAVWLALDRLLLPPLTLLLPVLLPVLLMDLLMVLLMVTDGSTVHLRVSPTD